MTNFRILPSAGAPSETVRHALLTTAQRELDALRAELDMRLAALEAALAHPQPGASLERLVIDLARVATAEAESAAVRAALEAQLQAQEDAGVAVAEAHHVRDAASATAEALRSELDANRAAGDAQRRELNAQRVAADSLTSELEAERDTVQQLSRDLADARAALERQSDAAARREQESGDVRASLKAERQAGAEAARDLDHTRAELKAALDVDAARGRRVEELERALQRERAATAEAESAAQSTVESYLQTQEQADAAAAEARNALAAANAIADGLRAERDANRAAADALSAELTAKEAIAAALTADLDAERGSGQRLENDLAMVQTALAEAQTALADAQTVLFETEAALERERESAAQLRHESEHARASLTQEHRQAIDEAARDLDRVRAELHEALAVGAADRNRFEELQRELERERASGAVVAADLALERDVVAELSAIRTTLERELGEARDQTQTRSTGEEAVRASIATLEQHCAELDEACAAAIDRASQAVRERDALAADLVDERRRVVETLAAADERIATIEAERADAERRVVDAEDSADEATAERDELANLLEAAKKSVQGMNAAVDERLAAIDAKRARALQAAEKRAEAAVRERDALATELASLQGAAAGAADDAARLDAAMERVRSLELQLFGRDHESSDHDVELEPLLAPEPAAEPTPPPPGEPAKRYGFKPLRKVQIDRQPALLVDLSLTGAQVIYARSPDVGQIVTLALLSDEAPVLCEGRLMWARREQTAKGRPYRYPAGIGFTSIEDAAAVEAFIARHAVKQE
jgi:chromosome segregation ATPase